MKNTDLVTVSVSVTPEVAAILAALSPQPEAPAPVEPEVPAPAKPPTRGRLLTVKQTSEALGISSVTLRRMIKNGRIKAVLINRYHRIREADLLAFTNGSN